MAVVKCKNGHFYDDSKYSSCPHCSGGLSHVNKEDYHDDISELKTMMDARMTEMKNTPQAPPSGFNEDVTVALDAVMPDDDGESKTIGAFCFEKGTKLPTGWLVCMTGPSRGRDYRVYSGWNRIGRSLSMDINLADDAKVSYENHASVIYEDTASAFYVVSDQGSLTYVNGELVENPVKLRTGDEIVLGGTCLVFIAFCTEDRKW